MFIHYLYGHNEEPDVNLYKNTQSHRGVLISGCWNKGVPLFKEVSSFQEVGVKEFNCTEVSSFHGVGIEGVPLYTEVSSFQGVGIEEFHCIQRCPHLVLE